MGLVDGREHFVIGLHQVLLVVRLYGVVAHALKKTLVAAENQSSEHIWTRIGKEKRKKSECVERASARPTSTALIN